MTRLWFQEQEASALSKVTAYYTSLPQGKKKKRQILALGVATSLFVGAVVCVYIGKTQFILLHGKF